MRVSYFDGVKGLAALVVMFTHFVLCFSSISYLQYIPIVGMLFDGGMAVYIFVLLSAFGICCSLSRDDVESVIVSTGIKRYFRLTQPIILPSLLAFVISYIGWNYSFQVGDITGNEWTKNLLPENVQLRQLTSGIIVGALKGSALINPLWMMKYIFFGTFLTIPLFFTVRRIKKSYLKFIYLAFFAIVLYSISPYYSATILGIILYQFHLIKTNNSTIVSLMLFLIVLLLHVYDIDTTKYLRGVLLVFSVEYCMPIQRLLKSRLLLKLNEISYQLYLVHATVLASVCCYVYLCVIPSYRYYIAFTLFIIITFVLSILFTEFDKNMNRRMNDLYKKALN